MGFGTALQEDTYYSSFGRDIKIEKTGRQKAETELMDSLYVDLRSEI